MGNTFVRPADRFWQMIESKRKDQVSSVRCRTRSISSRALCALYRQSAMGKFVQALMGEMALKRPLPALALQQWWSSIDQ
jgi:hypothetical protein